MNSLRHYITFLASWIKTPRMIGAIAPSSKRLARAMVAQIAEDAQGSVVEIGAGTGVMTRAIAAWLSQREQEARVLVVERNHDFYALLHRAFQENEAVSIVHGDAQALSSILSAHGIERVCAIISSLPLLSLPIAVRDAIIAEMAEAIGQHGRIIQFSYGIKSPIPDELLQQHGLKAKRAAFVLANIPPARVWVYQHS
jgi:phosphatidylethanolamine/phosphatidyl-N-methylethanolamine N-methyltransferase